MFLLRSILAYSLSWGAVASHAATPPTNLHWLRYEAPVFPEQLRPVLVQDGFATLIFTFDETGRITDRIVLAASHPAFIYAVYDAVRHWQVDTVEFARSVRRDTIRFEFVRQAAIVTMTQRDAIKSAFDKFGDQQATALRTCHEEQLPFELEMLTTVMPKYPASLAEQHPPGFATVNFVVDVEGRVRVPAVTDASDPEFGEAALAAVRPWRFIPPVYEGVPTQVMVERTFRFNGREGKK